ncbi:MAG: hypothetical protein COW00_14355 [Bdellovibrio sp. CG12_big_fil_rev_8_21_14_0_65_39_13]|nr:MAG: hypothetical protein COW78_07900 [Bdellovibrio sp. CG22_combo_CG10-13_8_21_14_all_39_27]PIQ58795.1 MAG: hypothetical protein COW00_14355 [Bdellovibrio sp. CG12_big_fil_rev_8_21_14_0_65_39_13]PIR35524.1 MAG: hypothetical protein COV37_08595 [Bdellovibrio sp. CG11_big_fil_rev_8_21_14_0_20_39_38]
MSFDSRPYSVLVVDDDKKICDLIKAFLKVGTEDLQTVVANDATQALFKLENQEFHVLILDQNLPGKSGVEFVRQLRKMLKHSSIRVVLMSAILSKEDVQSALQVGIDDILVKPFTFAQMMAKIRPLLKKPTQTLI